MRAAATLGAPPVQSLRPSPPRPRGALSRFWIEPALVLGGILAYFGVRGLTDDHPIRAQHNAADIWRLERWLHLGVEHWVQGLIIDRPVLVDAANGVYIWGHWPVIAAAMLWLLIRHPDTLRRLRSAMFVSGAVALVVFALVPVAPPRLFDLGLVDTVTAYSNAYRVLQPPTLVNVNAAMPSLHCGWNLLVGLALVATTPAGRRGLPQRVLGTLMPLVMTFSVVATANHYLVDIFAGEALALACWILVARRRRVPASAPAAGPASGHRVRSALGELTVVHGKDAVGVPPRFRVVRGDEAGRTVPDEVA